MRRRATFSSGTMHASNSSSGVAAAVREKTSASSGAISRDTAVGETLLVETPTGSSPALAASMAPTLRISAPKLSDVNRSVTHPIRLLHENLMFELFQEQLRMPSPVRQSTGSRNSRSRRAADLSTASLSGSYTAATGRQRGSAGNGNSSATRSSLDGGRASISLLQTPRPTIILYEELPSSLLDARVSVGRPSSSSPLTRATAAEFELELEQSSRVSAASLSAIAAPAPMAATPLPATAASLTVVSAAAMDGFDTAQQRDCQICFDKMDALQAHVCVTCSGSFCSTCMQWYVEFKIQDGEVSHKKLVCPAPQCTRALPEELIEAFASPEVFAKYQSFVRNQRAGVRFCPRAGCCAVLDEPPFSTHRRVACSACARESCMRCGDTYHPTRLCRRVDKCYSKWKRHHNVRACPSCKSDIEKQGGCSHMKCFQCDQEFCWSCLRSWDSHDETLCLPLAFYHSRSRKYGWTTPVRFVTKTVVLGVAGVVAVAGAGVAVVVLPPLIGYHLVRDSYRRKKHRRRLSGLQPPDVAPPA